MPLSEQVYCVAVAFKMTEWVEQQICIKVCVKLEHSFMETIQMIQKAAARDSWWLTASSGQCACSCITSQCRVYWRNIKSLRQLSPPAAQIWCPATSDFSKSKSTFEREEISDLQWDSGKYNRSADGDWENCVRSQSAYFEGHWGVIALCTMFLVSSSVNVSIFHSTWPDTFWTDIIH